MEIIDHPVQSQVAELVLVQTLNDPGTANGMPFPHLSREIRKPSFRGIRVIDELLDQLTHCQLKLRTRGEKGSLVSDYGS